ncbi:Hypothetical predicted protein [Podarcis lilfordi]|uniref:Uncharacterized protein n=1 Tax=Podarcis lilfordi TaxID=74358 RepID=A0AA35NWI5_9SAUR|nr:Hypothetical predicted protein [Podarcis lilfordi]
MARVLKELAGAKILENLEETKLRAPWGPQDRKKQVRVRESREPEVGGTLGAGIRNSRGSHHSICKEYNLVLLLLNRNQQDKKLLPICNNGMCLHGSSLIKLKLEISG